MQQGMPPLTFQHPYLSFAMHNPITTITHTHMSKWINFHYTYFWLHMSVFLNEKTYFNDCARKSTYDETSPRDNADESEVQHTLSPK